MKKPLIVLASFFTVATVLLILRQKRPTPAVYTTTNNITSDAFLCHVVVSDKSLPDISDYPPDAEKRNIFFLETSCNSYNMGKLFIKARQACAVESAARLNPSMDVNLLFASPGELQDENSESDRILQILASYPNIKLMRFNVDRYVRGTPVEDLWKSGKIKTSLYPLAHTSDILRLVTLWKFGGIYLDLDVIVIKSLYNLSENFGGAESDNLVANGVLGLGKYGKGHQYASECLEDVGANFDGTQWSYNGPRLISRTIFRHCPRFDAGSIVRFGRCEEFRIYPPSAFYLIPYPKWLWFFDKNLTEIIEPYIEERSYLLHVWNKLSFNQSIPKTDLDVPYLSLASKYCPGVVQQLDDYF